MPKDKDHPLVEEAERLIEQVEAATQGLAEKGTSNEPDGLLVTALTQLSTAVRSLITAVGELQKK